MIVALTGGTGFLGGHVLTQLSTKGRVIRALTRKPQAARDGVIWVAGALDDDAALAELCAGADAVVHVAGVVNAPDNAAFDAGNRLGTMAILHAAEAAGVARFVHISSLAAREPELSIYGASKRAAEDAVVTSGLDWRVVRPPAIYGPGDKDMLDVFRMARRGFVLLPPRGLLSVIHADDLARLIVALVDDGDGHEVYEVDDGAPTGWTHEGFARAIGDAVGRKVAVIHGVPALLKLGAAADALIRRKAAKLTADRVGYFCHPDWTIDPFRRPKRELWQPEIATPDGLKATAAWYAREGWL